MEIGNIDYLDPKAAEKFADSLHHTGFAIIKNHKIKASLIHGVYKEWQNFFNHDYKFDYPLDNQTQVGYTPFRQESAKQADYQNLLEYFNYYPWGTTPSQVTPLVLEYHTALVKLAREALAWLDASMPAEISAKLSMSLYDMTEDAHRMLLRIIHYPPIPDDVDKDDVRAAEHEDIDLLTMLPAPSESGLQVKDNNGNWHEVHCNEDDIIVNAGDMLQTLTDGYIASTTHQVVNPTDEVMRKTPRMSTPLFVHPRDEVRINDEYDALGYLRQRLAKNGVYFYEDEEG